MNENVVRALENDDNEKNGKNIIPRLTFSVSDGVVPLSVPVQGIV